jgi:hypothetical protein
MTSQHLSLILISFKSPQKAGDNEFKHIHKHRGRASLRLVLVGKNFDCSTKKHVINN